MLGNLVRLIVARSIVMPAFCNRLGLTLVCGHFGDGLDFIKAGMPPPSSILEFFRAAGTSTVKDTLDSLTVNDQLHFIARERGSFLFGPRE